VAQRSPHRQRADRADPDRAPRGRPLVHPPRGRQRASTGYVVAWEPPDRLVVTWQIGGDWRYDPKLVTTVELAFVEEAPDRTRVRLEHRDLERFGPEAERMRQVFEAPGAWDATLAAFASAFGDAA
jgi:uncharacterized protein YndB with AHSA1/START domain